MKTALAIAGAFFTVTSVLTVPRVTRKRGAREVEEASVLFWIEPACYFLILFLIVLKI